ncbi:MAG: glutathione binding-like protein [Bdellovibrionales bacterium]
MVELYYGKGSCAMAAHIALIASETPYNLHLVDLAKGEQSNPEFLKINPKGYVPAMKTDIGVLTEAQVVLQYIADQAPAKNLFPKAGTPERYHAMEWLNFVATEMHKGIGAFFALKSYENRQTQEDLKQGFIKKLEPRFEILNQQLSKNTFLLGNQFSIADAYLVTILGWTRFFQLDLSKWPVIMGYMEKLSAHPAVQKAMKEEGLV